MERKGRRDKKGSFLCVLCVLCVRSAQEPVLDREDRGGGARRDSELVVDVLDVMTGGLRRDAERVGHLLVRLAARDETQHFDFAIGEALRPFWPCWRRPTGPPRRGAGGGQDGVHRGGVELACGHVFTHDAGRFVERQRRTMWARLKHRLAYVGGGKDACGAPEVA